MAAAAFALPAGQTSGPVQGDLGLAVLQVLKVTPATTANFEAARPAIEADLRTKLARSQAYDLSKKFDDARQGGSSLVDAARKAGVAVLTLGPVTADGVGTDGKPIATLTPQILKSAFAKAANEDGDLEDAGSGEYFAVHIDKVLPPALPSIDEKRALLTQAYMHEQVLKALKARADALIAQVRKGESMDQAASQVGAHVVRQAGMERIQAQQYKALGNEVLQGVFTAKPGDVFAAGADNGLYLVRLDAVRPGDIGQMARAVRTIEGRLTQDYMQDTLSSIKAAARQEIKVSINANLARQTLGVDPAAVAGAGGKPTSPSK